MDLRNVEEEKKNLFYYVKLFLINIEDLLD